MKRIIKAFQFFNAFLFGSFPIIIAGVVSYVLLLDFNGVVAKGFAMLLCFSGLLIGYDIFKAVYRRGIVRFFTHLTASPDYDNMAPSSNSTFRQLAPEELAANFKTKKSTFLKGFVQIWGDFKSRGLEERSQFVAIEFDKEEQTLSFKLENGNKLFVKNPNKILEGRSCLKIIEADGVRWEWNEKETKDLFMEYTPSPIGIKRETNSNWKLDAWDILDNDPAVVFLS